MRSVLLLWLLCHPALGWSQQPPPCPKPPVEKARPEDQRPKPPRCGSQDSPFVVKLDSVQANQQAAQAQRESDQQAATQGWMTWLTAGLLFVGFLQVVLFGKQLGLMELANDTSRAQLRAYVFVTHGEIGDPLSPKGVNVRIVVKNSGQTPAYRLSHSVVGRSIQTPGEGTFPNFRDVPSAPVEPKAALGPGNSFTMNAALPAFTQEELAAFPTAVKVMFIFGEIRYRDVFQVPRLTRYCFVFGGQYGHSKGRLSVCEIGNEAD